MSQEEANLEPRTSNLLPFALQPKILFKTATLQSENRGFMS